MYGKVAIISIELELIFLCLTMQVEELNSTDTPQRGLALLVLEEHQNHSLANLKLSMQIKNKSFNKKYKSLNFTVNQIFFMGL